jgi:hypothetical protein
MENDRYKFRFWDEEDKKYTYYDSPWGMSRPYTETSTFPQYESCPRFHEGILERCTGLSASKSYRGNKPEDLLIWEGDKLIHHYGFVCSGEKGVVFWDKNKAGFYFIGRSTTTELWRLSNLEIIGNVHEEAGA